MIGFFIGLFIGGFIGIAVMAILSMASESDKQIENDYKESQA